MEEFVDKEDQIEVANSWIATATPTVCPVVNSTSDQQHKKD